MAKKRNTQENKRPGPFALAGKRYPIGDVAHAGYAITRLYMESVSDEDRKKVIAAIKKRYPKNKKLMERIKTLIEKKKIGKKRKTTKKGNRRKGAKPGARLAYDALKRKKRKKKPAKKKPAKKKATKRRKKRRTTKKGDLRKTSRRAYKKPKKSKDILDMLTSELF